MRNQLKRGHSTKAERRFVELMKETHIPFKSKVLINGREVDFLIGHHAIEIDGHKQDVKKNEMLVAFGYIPIHFNNWEVNERLKDWLINLK